MNELTQFLAAATIFTEANWLTVLLFDLDAPAALQRMILDEPAEYVAAAVMAVNTKGE